MYPLRYAPRQGDPTLEIWPVEPWVFEIGERGVLFCVMIRWQAGLVVMGFRTAETSRALPATLYPRQLPFIDVPAWRRGKMIFWRAQEMVRSLGDIEPAVAARTERLIGDASIAAGHASVQLRSR